MRLSSGTADSIPENSDLFLVSHAPRPQPISGRPMKKADAVEHPRIFHRVGLLFNRPSGLTPNCTLSSRPKGRARYGSTAQLYRRPLRTSRGPVFPAVLLHVAVTRIKSRRGKRNGIFSKNSSQFDFIAFIASKMVLEVVSLPKVVF